MKAFVIHLPDRPHSVSHATKMVTQLREYGIDANLWIGTTGDEALKAVRKAGKSLYPYSIKSVQLSTNELRDFIKPEKLHMWEKRFKVKVTEKLPIGQHYRQKMSSPGVIGCFYSHYNLWKHCMTLREPIMIFEDDVKFYRGYEPVLFEEVLILSLGKSSFHNEPYFSYLERPTGYPQARPWRNFSMPGASGYAITPIAAKKLCKFYRPYWYPADNAINRGLVDIEIHTHLMGRNTLKDEGNVSMTKSSDWEGWR